MKRRSRRPGRATRIQLGRSRAFLRALLGRGHRRRWGARFRRDAEKRREERTYVAELTAAWQSADPVERGSAVIARWLVREYARRIVVKVFTIK